MEYNKNILYDKKIFIDSENSNILNDYLQLQSNDYVNNHNFAITHELIELDENYCSLINKLNFINKNINNNKQIENIINNNINLLKENIINCINNIDKNIIMLGIINNKNSSIEIEF